MKAWLLSKSGRIAELVGWALIALVVPTIDIALGRSSSAGADYLIALCAFALGWGIHAIGARHGKPLGIYEEWALVVVACFIAAGLANLVFRANPEVIGGLGGAWCGYLGAGRFRRSDKEKVTARSDGSATPPEEIMS